MSVAAAMAAALRVHSGQRIAVWSLPGLDIGVIEPPALPGERDDLEPATVGDNRFVLWMAGEAFTTADAHLAVTHAAGSRTATFRRALLARWLERGVDVIRDLVGEYHIAMWDARDRVLTIANDRFGGLPMYWCETPGGVAFAGGVRGVLMAPAVRTDPDVDALREAVSFGGYRLGSRTNVASVHMVESATVQTIASGRRSASRYWSWKDIPPLPGGDLGEIVEQVQSCWRRSIADRMSDEARYGQTLSGGLDSRAILAEAGAGRDWTAITYGVPGCDDAVYARRAAAAAGATWIFQPLYAGDWLHNRTAHIQSTDGLIDLSDLMHLESLPLQRAHFDVHMSGYIGDVVSGPTYAAVRSPEDVLQTLPWYGASISLPYEVALERARDLISGLNGAPARFALLEHKAPQSTNRWTAAWRPWLRVRKPFIDYAFFDLCQGLPVGVRLEGRLHERWLRTSYPDFFAKIPNHKTGLPVLAAEWRIQEARLLRGARRRLLPLLPAPWRPAARIRSYHDNELMWRQPGPMAALTEAILRPGAIAAEVFGRARVTELLNTWNSTGAAPAQVIGALYVYETYHAQLARHLLDARAEAAPLHLTTVR
jgi:asparagine synthase (glutamine-hydrolysing)